MYTIKIFRGFAPQIEQVLTKAVEASKFNAKIVLDYDKGKPVFYVKPIRLKEPKPYCGQHPGECPVNGRLKRPMRYLEWEDWIEFHDLVNDVLDEIEGVIAEVWTDPMEWRGRMWIRKCNRRRVRWDYTEKARGFGGQVIRYANMGTDDQFEEAKPDET